MDIKGKAIVKVDSLKVRGGPSTKSEDTGATYKRNNVIVFDQAEANEGYLWVSWIGGSGKRRYSAAIKIDHDSCDMYCKILFDDDATIYNKRPVDSMVAEAIEKTKEEKGPIRAARIASVFAYHTDATAAQGGNGTPAYIKMHDIVFPEDDSYRLCNRGASAAICFSGLDLDFPIGSTNEQFIYCQSSNKWKDLGEITNFKIEDFEVGDLILCGPGHVMIYIGEELADEYHLGKITEANTVSAASGVRGPSCNMQTNEAIEYPNSAWSKKTYHVFRCVLADNSDKFLNQY